jgi:hypothetical protein
VGQAIVKDVPFAGRDDLSDLGETLERRRVQETIAVPLRSGTAVTGTTSPATSVVPINLGNHLFGLYEESWRAGGFGHF